MSSGPAMSRMNGMMDSATGEPSSGTSTRLYMRSPSTPSDLGLGLHGWDVSPLVLRWFATGLPCAIGGDRLEKRGVGATPPLSAGALLPHLRRRIPAVMPAGRPSRGAARRGPGGRRIQIDT